MAERLAERLMVLPSKDVGRIRLVTVPEDMSSHEAYGLVAGLTAEVERTGDNHWVEDALDVLEDYGFETVDFLLGPPLD